MKQLTLGESIFIAFVLTALVIPLKLVLVAFFSVGFAFRLLWSFLALSYLLVGVGLRRGQVGALILICGSVVILSFSAFLLPSYQHCFVCVILICVIRSLCRYSSFLSGGLDLALSITSLAFSCWAYSQTGSVLAGIWGLFLLQSLTAIIPRKFEPRKIVLASDAGRFEQAYGTAEQALRQIITRTV